MGHQKEQTPWPGCVWTGMKTSPMQWLVECVGACWGSAWPPQPGRSYSYGRGGHRTWAHQRSKSCGRDPSLGFWRKCMSFGPRSVTTAWLRVFSHGKAPSPGSGAAPEGPTQGMMEKSNWNRGLSLFGGARYTSRVWGPVVAITGLHLPVALLFGTFSLRGAHALPTSRTASAEGSCGSKEAVMLARVSSLPTRPRAAPCTKHAWQSSQGVIFFFFLLSHQSSLRELPETCRIAAFVCLMCQTTLCITGLGRIALHGCSLPELLLLILSLAGCQLQTHRYFFFSHLIDFFFSLPNLLHGWINRGIHWLR